MGETVYLNGELRESNGSCVAASNPSFLHGVGLFETLRAYDGRPFRLQQHIDRMAASARHFDMPVASLLAEVPQALTSVLTANQLQNARIRFTVTPPGAYDETEKPTLLVAAQQITGYPVELYEKGMTVHLETRWRQSGQDPLAGHKTTSYFPRLLALREAQAAGCGEGLWFTPDNRLAEGCMSNVFLVKNGKLRTPTTQTPVLPGVTRAVVMELAREAGMEVEEAACTINDLLDADEVFLTNAIMEIMPVTRIERKSVSGEKPGPVTVRLTEAYREMAARP